MKTTLDLPEDVAALLRRESARLGGRRKASLSSLVSRAVREVYAGEPAAPARVDFRGGRVIVRRASDAPVVDANDVAAALDD